MQIGASLRINLVPWSKKWQKLAKPDVFAAASVTGAKCAKQRLESFNIQNEHGKLKTSFISFVQASAAVNTCRKLKPNLVSGQPSS